MKYKQATIQKDIDRLSIIREQISENSLLISNAIKNKNSLSTLEYSEDEIQDFFDFTYLEDIKNKIDSKVKDMSWACDINIADISTIETKIIDKDSELKNKREEALEKINSNISNMETLTKGAIAIKIHNSDNVNSYLKEIKALEKEIEAITQKNEENRQEIVKLREKLSEYGDFKDFLNEVLISLDLQFKLDLVEDNYYLVHINGSHLNIEDISEGEKNLLALLFFYFELFFDNKQEKLKENIELILIDDPVSSLDDANKFYVLEIIGKILDEKKPQIFVFTHSWNDFCSLSYHHAKNSDVKLFEIFKNSKTKNSELRDIKKMIKPYEKLFKEIYNISKSSEERMDDCDIYHSANTMRRVFEEFLNFKKTGFLAQRSNQKEIEDLYCKASGQRVGKNFSTEIGALLAFINVLSHNPRITNEVKTNAKTLMRIIKDMDKVHFEEMVRQ